MKAKANKPMNELPTNRHALLKGLSVVFILITLGMMVVVSIKYYVNPSEGLVDELYTMTKYSLVIAFVSYLIWRFFQKKEGIGLLYFSIILLVVGSYRYANMMGEVYEETDTAEQIAAFEKEYKAILRHIATNEDVEPKRFNRATYGELAPMLQALNSWKVQLQKDMVAMREEMQGPATLALVASIVKPETIKSLKLIREGKAKLSIHRSVNEKYTVFFQEREQKLFQDINKIITYSSIRPARKQRLLAGIAEPEDGNHLEVSAAKVFAISTSLIDETTSFLDFIESKQGEYTVFWKMVLFKSKEDLDTFDKHKKEIIRIEAKFSSEKARIKDFSTQYTEELEKQR